MAKGKHTTTAQEVKSPSILHGMNSYLGSLLGTRHGEKV